MSNTFNVTNLTLCDVDIFDINSRANSFQERGYDRWLYKEEEFDLGGLNIDRPITWVKSKKFQQELNKETKFSNGGKKEKKKWSSFILANF